MKGEMVLIQDIIIPAGTVFHRAPVKTERFGGGHIHATIGLTNNTAGDITYCIDEPCDEEEISEYFRELK